MHPMYVALQKVTWPGAWLYGVHSMCQDGSSFTWHQPCNNQIALYKHTTLVDIQKHNNKKKLVTHAESHASAVSDWEQRIALCRSDQQQQQMTSASTSGLCYWINKQKNLFFLSVKKKNFLASSSLPLCTPITWPNRNCFRTCMP